MDSTASVACTLIATDIPSTIDPKGRKFESRRQRLPLTPPCSPGSEYPPRPASAMALQAPVSMCETPAKPIPRNSRDSFSPSASGLAGGMRTLIVDDNPINLAILERTLKRYFSHLIAPEIATATSGIQALYHLSQHNTPKDELPPILDNVSEQPQSPFDLILLDIDMPDISGVQVAEQIRNVQRDGTTAIVAVTTSIEPEQRRTYERVGMDGVVAKPLDLTILDRVMTRALLARRGVVCRPRTSSVPPLPREVSLQTFLQPEIAGKKLERLLSPSGSSTPLSPLDLPLCRRSSFPLSLEELHLMREGDKSPELTSPEHEEVMVESFASTTLDPIPAKMSYFDAEYSV